MSLTVVYGSGPAPTVVLPLTLATSPDEPGRPKVADLLTTHRIVFVDDEPNLLAGLRRMLRIKRDVWDTQFAESGQQALALMAEQPFDVVVSDMRMPGMDGGAD